MHLYPQRWNVAAQVAEELKMVMEQREKTQKVALPQLNSIFSTDHLLTTFYIPL